MASLLDSHKALIITILLSSTVVLMAFNVHLKKKNDFEAETYYELLPEETEEMEQEELADLIKSLDDLMSTNRAYNETDKTDALDDEDFKNTLEKIRNRASDTEIIEDAANDQSTSRTYNNDDLTSYEDINSIIANRSEKKRTALPTNTSGNKNSSVSYSLVNRTDEYLPPPIYLCEQSGKIVINIEVDHKGNVISALVNTSSTSSDGCLIDHALEYARASKFNKDPTRAKQLGTITFIFLGKS